MRLEAESPNASAALHALVSWMEPDNTSLAAPENVALLAGLSVGETTTALEELTNRALVEYGPPYRISTAIAWWPDA